MTIVNSNHEQTQPATTEPPVLASGSVLERTFKIAQRGSTVKREIRGGIVTFFTMAYIVVLNPLILGGFSPDAAPVDVAGNFLPAAAVGAATGLTAGLLTIVFGWWRTCPSGSPPDWASTPSWPSPSSATSPGPRPWAWSCSTASSSCSSR